MARTLTLNLPQAASWLLRIATNESISLTLMQDAVAFAGWYAVVGEALPWPQEADAIRQAEREKKLSLDRMMKLLSQVNYTLSGRANAEHARRVLEGYAMHDWVRKNMSEFRTMTREVLKGFDEVRLHENASRLSEFAANIERLGEVLGLVELEREILAFAFLTTGSAEIEGVFGQLATDRWSAAVLWTALFDTDREALARAMRPSSPLRLSGILRPGLGNSQLARVSPFWLELLAQEDSLFDAVLEPFDFKVGAGAPARLTEEDKTLAGSILTNARESGVNLLLYGASSLEKRPVTQALLAQSNRRAWRVRRFEEAGRQDTPSLTLVAFKLLGEHDKASGDASVLVIEKPEAALQPVPSEFVRALFGIELDNTELPAFDEHLLATNDVPGIWYASNVASLSPEAVARFVFQAPLKKADKEERTRYLKSRIESLKLGKKATEDILKLEGVSGAQLESAVKAAKLAGLTKKSERDAAIVQAVRRSQRALGRDLQAKSKPSVTQYSLKYLNTAGRFGPTDILEALKRNPRGTMVLYGPPGTGKTQFVEHMAVELGMPLVTKRASDLLSKWLGESEKNIAAAFEEAASEDAILFLDEGDSFLRDRNEARASWEVTQVNELLQHMERFEGIVVVCTNLFRGLDSAALRRFTFKVEFRQLDADQRWEMFVNETGLKGQLSTIKQSVRDEWWEKLCFMKQLTAGDFATVKRQCNLLGTTLTPEQWLEQLQIEVDVKTRDDGSKTVN